MIADTPHTACENIKVLSGKTEVFSKAVTNDSIGKK